MISDIRYTIQVWQLPNPSLAASKPKLGSCQTRVTAAAKPKFGSCQTRVWQLLGTINYHAPPPPPPQNALKEIIYTFYKRL